MNPTNEAESLSLRMQHAWTHIQDIQAAVGEWAKGDPFVPYTKCYARNNQFTYLIRARGNNTIPDDLGIVVGKAVHQMRAALDNSISIIAPPSFKYSTSFPVLLDGDMSTLLSRSGIDAIDPNIALYLDSIQPYNTPDRNQRKGHFLYILNELWNEDKHRTIPLLGILNKMGVIDHKPGEEVIDSGITRRVYEGTILIKVISPYPERDFQPKFAFDIAFKAGPAANRSVETVLIDCHNGTKEILTEIIPGFVFDYPT